MVDYTVPSSGCVMLVLVVPDTRYMCQTTAAEIYNIISLHYVWLLQALQQDSFSFYYLFT